MTPTYLLRQKNTKFRSSKQYKNETYNNIMFLQQTVPPTSISLQDRVVINTIQGLVTANYGTTRHSKFYLSELVSINCRVSSAQSKVAEASLNVKQLHCA